MASIDYQGDDDQIRQQQPQPAPIDPRAGNTFDYGNGEIASKVDGGWKYSWRDQPYQDLLSDTDVNQQRQLQQFRNTNSGAAADDAGALWQMANPQQMTTRNAISAAQSGASRDQYSLNAPPFQFSDPYTRQLEDVARQQMSNLSQPQQNPALDNLLKFLGERFNTMTTQPGYSNEEMALLRTQAMEPIEQDRAASQRRVLERTAARGFLPSSGLTELGSQEQDVAYDRMRAQASRDLGINAISQRRADLNQAINVGSLAGIQIPQAQRQEDQQRRSEILNLASLLYDLPRRAMQDSMSVVNGTEGPRDLFTQTMQMQQQAQQQQQLDAQKWAQIGQLIAGLVF